MTQAHEAAADQIGERAMTKYVYDFEEGSREMRNLLGGKGSGLAEMTRQLGSDVVPAGFVVTTEACVEYMRAGDEPPELEGEVTAALARLETKIGRKFGDPADPLLLSVRSGARESMPGMMDTVLNLGLTDESVLGLAGVTGNERFAWDSYRRFVQMFSNVVHGVPTERLEGEIARIKRERGVALDTELDVAALKELTAAFKAHFRTLTGEDFPQDPGMQLHQAMLAVFGSWGGARAIAYRRINQIPDDWGTAVNVQQMVFGNRGAHSCSGVAFSRDEVTGAPTPSGDFLINAQGEDVVSGVRNTSELSELAEVMPESYERLVEILRKLERHLRRHAGHRVHDRRGPPVHAADAQREAAGPGRRSLRRRRGRGGAARQGEGDTDDRRRQARRAAPPHLRPQRQVRGARAWRGRLAGRREGDDRAQRASRAEGRGGR
jgi:pyruvate,orthophosphate dikinase